MTKYLNFLSIGMFGHEAREVERIREDKERMKNKKGRQKVKDCASSSDLIGDCIGVLSKKA